MKAKKIGLTKNKYIKNKTKFIIFSLKLITLIKPEKQIQFFEGLKRYSIKGEKKKRIIWFIYRLLFKILVK